MDFDVVIATPDAMRIVALAQFWDRVDYAKSKVGTVTPNVEEAVKNAKAGQVRYRTDKNGIIHAAIGKVGFTPEALKANLDALLVIEKGEACFRERRLFQESICIDDDGPGGSSRSVWIERIKGFEGSRSWERQRLQVPRA